MAQLGFHGLIGVGLARLVVPGETQEGSLGAGSSPKGAGGSRTGQPALADPARNLRWGLVVGSILPDTDFFLLGPLYLINAQLGLAMHRTFTHSLLVAAAVLGYFRLRSGGGRDKALWSLGVGIAAGLAVHSLTDLVVWFSGVDLLWPLGLLGLPSWVNFWAGHVNPP
ncbi:MAG TPA: metal-dependent hydrolase, partial [Limnochordales bacterium]